MFAPQNASRVAAIMGRKNAEKHQKREEALLAYFRRSRKVMRSKTEISGAVVTKLEVLEVHTPVIRYCHNL